MPSGLDFKAAGGFVVHYHLSNYLLRQCSASDNIQTTIESVYITSTSSSSEFPRILATNEKVHVSTFQAAFRPVSLLSISNVSSFRPYHLIRCYASGILWVATVLSVLLQLLLLQPGPRI